jgi:hypothetical protein
MAEQPRLSQERSRKAIAELLVKFVYRADHDELPDAAVKAVGKSAAPRCDA